MKKDRSATKQRLLSYVFILIFFFALWLPLLQMAFSFLPEVRLAENRFLAAKPDIREFKINKPVFQIKFEQYFNDHFGFRSVLIYLNNYARVIHLNASPNPLIAIGKEGWLYFDDSTNPAFKDYMGVAWYNENQLDKIVANLTAINRELTRRKITFFVVIAPDKQTIYPEYLPDSIRKYRPKTKLDQLLERLRYHMPELYVVDLRSALLREKKKAKYPLFYKTDTHWNNYGAFISSVEILTALKLRHAEIKPPSMTDMEIQEFNSPGQDIALMLAMSDVLEDKEVHLVGKNIHQPIEFEPVYTSHQGSPMVGFTMDNSKFPKLLMFRDSFGTRLIPYLSRCFFRSVFILSTKIDWAVVDQEKPDIIILEIVERHLDRLL
jgi:hypothetical protein